MIFGRYSITELDADSYWMVIDSGEYEGEGMQVSKAVLNAYLDKFYKENF